MARVKKRADGRYCSQIYLGRDENGKRQYKSVYGKSPAELKEKETAVRLQLGRGLDVLSQRDSFDTWADDWLRLKEKEHITYRQMDSYRRAVKLWKEELHGYEIGQVRADDVERVLLALSDRGLPHLRHITKTDAGMRTVDIPQRLIDYMSAMPKDNLLVIHSAHGEVMTASAWARLWQSYMRALNIKYGTRTPADLERMKSSKPGPKVFDMTIPPITMHWLRHTFCTLLYLAGVDVVQARAQMGHADVSTTLRIYTHLDAIHKRKSVDKLDAYLEQAKA